MAMKTCPYSIDGASSGVLDDEEPVQDAKVDGGHGEEGQTEPRT